MPIYEYACDDCSHTFELLRKVSDTSLPACPECESTHVRKLISRTSFVLKGGGWYRDHYGLKSSASSSSGSSKSSESSAAKAAK